MYPGEGFRFDVAFSTGPDDTAPAFEDVTSFVLMDPGLSITRGRSAESGTPSPGVAQFVLVNDDGRFTADNSSSPYYPNVKANRRCRISHRATSSLGLWNLAGFLDAEIESGSLSSWWDSFYGGSTGTTVTSSSTRSFGGTKSVLVTWPTATSPGAGFYLPTHTLVKGRRYVAALPVFVPTDGSPSVRFGDVFGATPTVSSTVTGRWQVLRVAFVATGFDVYLGLRPSVAPTAGQTVYMGRPRVDECGPDEPATTVDSGSYNATANPSFEVDTTGWSTGVGTVTSTVHSTARAGGRVGRVTVNTAQAAGLWLWLYGVTGTGTWPAAPGQLWSGRVSVREVGTGGAVPLSVRLGAYDAASNFLGAVALATATVPAGGSWIDVDVPSSAACPANTASVRWLIYSNNAAAAVGDAIDVDAAQTDLVSSVGATLPVGYVDGSLPTMATGVNLHSNGGADSTAAGWNSNDGTKYPIAWDGGRVRSSLSVAGPSIASIYAPGPAGLVASMPVLPGATVTASVDVIDPPPGMKATIYVVFRNQAGTVSNGTPVYTATPDVLNRITSAPTIVPNNADRCYVIIVVTAIDGSNQAVGTQVWLDNLDVRADSPAHYVWTGTPHASPSQRFLEPFPTASPFDAASGPAIRNRFVGFIGEWGVTWPAGPDLSRSAIVATDRMKRLASARPLRSVPEHEITADPNVRAYFPLSEEGGTTAADMSGAGVSSNLSVTRWGAGGQVALGGGTNGLTPAAASLPSAQITRADGSNGAALVATAATQYPASATPSSFGFEFVFSADDTALAGRLVAFYSAGNADMVAVDLDGSGFLRITLQQFGASEVTVASTLKVTDGVARHVSVGMTGFGAATQVVLSADGDPVATANAWGLTFPAWKRVEIGGRPPYMASLSIAHLVVDGGDHRAALMTGFAGESSDARISRVLGYAGVSTGDMSLDAGMTHNVERIDTKGQTALAVAQTVTATENGVLLVDRDGRVALHSRARRYSESPSAVLRSDQLAPDVLVTHNDDGLANDVTGKHQTGAAYRNTDATSIGDYGLATEELSLVTGDDLEVRDAVEWALATRGQPKSKTPAARLDLMKDDVRAFALDLDVSSRVLVRSMLTQAPADLDLFVEGYTEAVSAAGWSLSLNTSAVAEAGTVWVLEDPVRGQIEAGNVLAY